MTRRRSKACSVASLRGASRTTSLGCQTVDQTSNEITAIAELLKKLGLTGATITMDAMGSEKDIATQLVSDYNDCRLHRAIGDITPSDMLSGKKKAIHEERDRKLEEAREDRRKIRAQQATARYANKPRLEDRAMLGSNLSAESMPKASAMGVEAESLPPGTCHVPLATMR